MNLLALLLGIGGTATLIAAGAVLRSGRPTRETGEPELLLCEAPSPDDTLRCDQKMGHLAWHRCEGSEWFGDSWAVDQWADTHEAPPVDPEPTMSATQWAEQEQPEPAIIDEEVKETTAPAPAVDGSSTAAIDEAELNKIEKEAARLSRKLAADRRRREMEKLVAAGPPRPKQWTKYCEYLRAAQKLGGDPVPNSCPPSQSWALWELKAEAKRLGCKRYSDLNAGQLLALVHSREDEQKRRAAFAKLDKNELIDLIVTD